MSKDGITDAAVKAACQSCGFSYLHFSASMRGAIAAADAIREKEGRAEQPAGGAAELLLKARELLAAEYARPGRHNSNYAVELVLNGNLDDHPTMRAILAALCAQPAQGDAITVCEQHRNGWPCPTPDSCRENGCDAVERELFTSQPAQAVPEDVLIDRLTMAMREADTTFQRVGGSTRHYVRDCLMPILNKCGLKLVAAPEPELADQATNIRTVRER